MSISFARKPTALLVFLVAAITACPSAIGGDSESKPPGRIEAARQLLELRSGAGETSLLLRPDAAAVPLEGMPFWTTSEQGIYSTGMIWRDCNNDGYIDVFFSNGNDIVRAANNIYLSSGGLLPPAASWYSSDIEYSGHCGVGDIDDDGFPDFAVANFLGAGGFSTASQSPLYLNQGYLPAATPAWVTPDSMRTFSCALGDVDNDGDLDIAFATGEGYYAHSEYDRIYLNESGIFAGSSTWSSGVPTQALDVTWGDVDNDGDLDLAFTYDSRATAVFYNHDGAVETSPTWEASTIESGNTLLFGDINGDDWLDLVVAYNDQLGGGGHYKVYYNDGAGNLDPDYGWISSDGGYGSALALYDYDSDGDDDLATGRWFHVLWVYENLGDSLSSAPVWASDIEIVAEELAWIDIDGGGVEEIADTLTVSDSRKLFYTEHHPLQSLDSVISDGTTLDYDEFCYDLVSGWVSLASPPASEVQLYYQYSYLNDLTVSNWDTVNMAFANNAIDMAAVGSFGPVPLTVQFTDISALGDDWLWRFGDGDSSLLQNPSHEYSQPGYYSVTLTVGTPLRDLSRTFAGAVSAYADTLIFGNSSFQGGAGRIDVYARNYLPIDEISFAFTWFGDVPMRLDSISKAGHRTEYFSNKSIPAYDGSGRRAAVRLYTSVGQPFLEPGSGAVVSLFFTDSGKVDSGVNPIAFTSLGSYDRKFYTHAGNYQPVGVDGSLFFSCCQPPTVGDADCSGDIDITDIQIMVDHLFLTLAPLCCDPEGDTDLNGEVDITDLQILIDNQFLTLTPLPPCP